MDKRPGTTHMNNTKRTTSADGKFVRRASDKTIVRDLANLKGISKTDAVLQYVQQQRNNRQAPRTSTDSANDDHDAAAVAAIKKFGGGEKFVVPQREMAWTPEATRWMKLPPNSHSLLSVADHRRYVAIVSNFLAPKLAFRFEINKLELEGQDSRLREEREKFHKLAVLHILHFKVHPYNVVLKGSEHLFKCHERQKISDVMGELAFRDAIGGVAWPNAADTDIPPATYRLRVAQVLAEGRPRRVKIPDVRRRCQYYMNAGVIGDFLSDESAKKSNIDKDPFALDFALANHLEYVLDASTLRHLMVDEWTFRNQRFVNRVSVIRRVRDGMTHRVCFISKPVLSSALDLPYMHRQFMKWCAKTEIHRAYERSRGGIGATASSLATAAATADYRCSAGDGGDAADDLLGGILGSMGFLSPSTSAQNAKKPVVNGAGALTSSADVSSLPQPSSIMATAAATADYRYAAVSLHVDEKHSLLVRASNHGIDQEGKLVSLTVKNEYAPEVGAQKLHAEERLWNCVTATLKGSTEHLNLHMNPRNGHCIQIQRAEPMRTFSEMTLEMKQMLWTRIHRVCALMDEMEKLDIGDYLLVREGERLKILQTCAPRRLTTTRKKRKFSPEVDDYNFSTIAKKKKFLPKPVLFVLASASSADAATVKLAVDAEDAAVAAAPSSADVAIPTVAAGVNIDDLVEEDSENDELKIADQSQSDEAILAPAENLIGVAETSATVASAFTTVVGDGDDEKASKTLASTAAGVNIDDLNDEDSEGDELKIADQSQSSDESESSSSDDENVADDDNNKTKDLGSNKQLRVQPQSSSLFSSSEDEKEEDENKEARTDECEGGGVVGRIYDASSVVEACAFTRAPHLEQDRLKLWTEADEHLPLMWNIIQGRAPATFFPVNHRSNPANWHSNNTNGGSGGGGAAGGGRNGPSGKEGGKRKHRGGSSKINRRAKRARKRAEKAAAGAKGAPTTNLTPSSSQESSTTSCASSSATTASGGGAAGKPQTATTDAATDVVTHSALLMGVASAAADRQKVNYHDNDLFNF